MSHHAVACREGELEDLETILDSVGPAANRNKT